MLNKKWVDFESHQKAKVIWSIVNDMPISDIPGHFAYDKQKLFSTATLTGTGGQLDYPERKSDSWVVNWVCSRSSLF